MLDSLHIKNFRCFEDLTIPSLGRVNLIVGKNSVGKTTLLEALNIFANKGDNNTILEYLEKVDGYNQEFSYEHPSIPYESLFFNFSYQEKNTIISIGNEKKSIQIAKNKQSIDRSTVNNLTISTEIKEFLKSHISKNDLLEFFMVTSFPDSEGLEVLSIEKPESKKQNEKKISSIIRTNLEKPNKLAELWDEILLKNKEKEIISTLKIIDESAENIFFISPRNNIRIAYLKRMHDESSTILVPLKSMGEGVTRLLQIFLHAYQSRNGYLMIDEFENGLHYSIQEEVWEKLFKLAKELDIQVFATTHSEDTVKAFCKVSLAEEEVDGKLISLGRSAAIADNGKILADVYDEKTLAWIVQSGMEVR